MASNNRKNTGVVITPIDTLRPNLPDNIGLGAFIPRTKYIADAYQWGMELHAGQTRLSGEPYFETHCVWVANLIDHLVKQEAWTIAALLHDSVEDQGNRLNDIRQRFPGKLGDEAAYIVDGVTKLKVSIKGEARGLETLRKIARFRDPGIILVKLADKSHNIMTLNFVPEMKQGEKAREAIRVYGRLAGILNCYQWRRWLEDMAFPYADINTFSTVRSAIDNDPRLNLTFINSMMDILAEVMKKSNIPGEVKVIVNGYWQTWQKLRSMARLRKASLENYADVNDLISFRLVVDSEDVNDCYILLSGVNRYFGSQLDQDRFDDYIAYAQNGYRALQSTAWIDGYGTIEVAIATRDMEEENQWGVVHAINTGKSIRNYYPVTVITPSGSLRFVEEGASVLDAVAAIQQEFLLDKISSVQVNQQQAHLSDKVQPGDVIEVITGSPVIEPDKSWLNFCNQSTAKLLRAVLATQLLRKSALRGRQSIREILAKRGILALEDVEALVPEKIVSLLTSLNCANLEDLYSAVGGGAVRMSDVTRILDEIGISKRALLWTTVHLIGSSSANKPGALATLTAIVSNANGNIVRATINTTSDGGFTLRIVINNLKPEEETVLMNSYQRCDIELTTIEIV